MLGNWVTPSLLIYIYANLKLGSFINIVITLLGNKPNLQISRLFITDE